MFAGIFAQHQPYIPGFGSASASPAASPPPSPQPPSDPIAFSVVARAALFGIVGSAIGSTALATVTCADASMTVVLSHSVPGLTFSYAANVLSVSGTPSGAPGLTRVVVSYIASDGSGEVRGSSEHEITIVDATKVLTIGSMAGAVGRVGVPMSATLASPSTNYAVSVLIAPQTHAPGLTPELSWTVGGSSASGTLTLAGTPTQAGTYSLAVEFYGFGVLIGTSTHQVVIAEAYSALPPAPSPAPAPPAPSPSAPPAPTPAPSPGYGADPNLAATKVLMRFNSATGIARDERGNTFASSGPTSTSGAVNEGARFDSATDTIFGTVPGLQIVDAADESLTVEAMVALTDGGLWTAVYADGVRFMPVVSCVNPGGALVWTMGYISRIDASTPESPRRQVQPCFIVQTTGTELEIGGATVRNFQKMAVGPEIAPALGRFAHVAGMLEHGTPSKLAMWFDGRAPYGGACSTFSGSLVRPAATAVVRLGRAFVPKPGAGATLVDEAGNVVQIQTVLTTDANVDELRIKLDDHYGAFVTGTNTQAAIPATSRVIPWPNY